MSEPSIFCPECGREIIITEALGKQYKDQLQREFLKIQREKEDELRDREEDLRGKMEELEDQKRGIASQVQRLLKQERAKLQEEALKQAQAEIYVQIQGMQEQLEEKSKRLETAQQTELELLKMKRRMETLENEKKIEIEKALLAERKRLTEEVDNFKTQEYDLKLRERERVIDSLKEQINGLQQKLTQGSQELQGEVLELALEEALKRLYPYDDIQPVKKGKKGADIIQTVRSQTGFVCGTILWEAKRAKNWSHSWVQKLKDDQREAKAEVAILVTTVLPQDISNFAALDGIWVTNLECYQGLAGAVRSELLSVARIQQTMQGKGEKIEVLYNYISGKEFSQRIEAIVESFLMMRDTLEKEKTAMTRLWAERTKQIDRVLEGVSGMYGDMKGIVGASMPEIKNMELPALGEGE